MKSTRSACWRARTARKSRRTSRARVRIVLPESRKRDGSSPETQPPRSLKGKILEAVKSSGNVTEFAKAPPNRATFPVWAWAAAAALAILTGYSIRQIGNQDKQLAELRREMKIATLQNKALQDQLEVGRQA